MVCYIGGEGYTSTPITYWTFDNSPRGVLNQATLRLRPNRDDSERITLLITDGVAGRACTRRCRRTPAPLPGLAAFDTFRHGAGRDARFPSLYTTWYATPPFMIRPLPCFRLFSHPPQYFLPSANVNLCGIGHAGARRGERLGSR